MLLFIFNSCLSKVIVPLKAEPTNYRIMELSMIEGFLGY